jgi:NO-binding membrane sensor protein with MHYT domain
MISANAAMTGSYDYSEVARSVLIAIAASYAALDLAGRVTAASGRIRLAWLGGGAAAMGIGIWAMHFKGMLALHLPVPVEYQWPTVLASLLVAILASAVELYVTSRHHMGRVEALTGSFIMGGGIAGMHYIGMAAMRLPAITQFSPLLVTFSKDAGTSDQVSKERRWHFGSGSGFRSGNKARAGRRHLRTILHHEGGRHRNGASH